MSSVYTITYEEGITRVSLQERPDFNLAITIVDDIADNYPYKLRLWDFSNVGLDLTLQEIIALSEYGKSRYLDASRLAVVATDDFAYGEMRQFSSFREEEEKAAVRVFRDVEEAVNWLKA